MKKQAEYKCLSCGFQWKDNPSPVDCPICQKPWVEWTNYASDFERK